MLPLLPLRLTPFVTAQYGVDVALVRAPLARVVYAAQPPDVSDLGKYARADLVSTIRPL